MVKNRYLIKLSGEVLKGDLMYGISFSTLDTFCKRIATILNKNNNIELGFVVGGGNIFRGGRNEIEGYDRLYGDKIGMVATVINGLSLAERFKYYNINCTVQSAVNIDGVVGLFDRDKVEETFAKRGVAVFTGGTGNPYFSTDTTAVLRALQIDSKFVIKATKVDGIYDKDPEKFNDAKKIDKLRFHDIIEKELKIMDMTAIQMMRENNMKLMVLNMMKDGALESALSDEIVGSIAE